MLKIICSRNNICEIHTGESETRLAQGCHCLPVLASSVLLLWSCFYSINYIPLVLSRCIWLYPPSASSCFLTSSIWTGSNAASTTFINTTFILTLGILNIQSSFQRKHTKMPAGQIATAILTVKIYNWLKIQNSLKGAVGCWVQQKE